MRWNYPVQEKSGVASPMAKSNERAVLKLKNWISHRGFDHGLWLCRLTIMYRKRIFPVMPIPWSTAWYPAMHIKMDRLYQKLEVGPQLLV